MEYNLASMQPVLPEMFLLAAACLILVIDLFLSDRMRLLTYGLSLTALIGAVALTQYAAGAEREIILDGSFVRDPMSDVLKTGLLLVTLFAFVYAKDYLRELGLLRGEYFVLGLFAVLGMMVMISANSFLTLYLGLELLALCLYALVAFNRDSIAGAEAAMKYFVLGALASGMLLYGMSLVYGATGTLDLAGIHAAIQGAAQQGMLLMGVAFIVAGVAFKFGAAPFHMWLPDVYHGAPTPITLFIGCSRQAPARSTSSGACWSPCWRRCRLRSATWSRWCRPTSSACWRTRPSRTWASCSSASPAAGPRDMRRRCSTRSATR